MSCKQTTAGGTAVMPLHTYWNQPPVTWWLISFSAAKDSYSNPEYPAQY